MGKNLVKTHPKASLKKMLTTELAGYHGKTGKSVGLLFLGLQKLKQVLEGKDSEGNPIEGITIDQQLKANDTVIKLLPYVLDKEGDLTAAKGNPLAGLLGQSGTLTISFEAFKDQRNGPEKTSIEVIANQ